MLLTEIPIFEIIDARKAEFSKLIKYHDLRARVRGCTVLPNGNLLCRDHENSCCVLIKEKNQETIQHSTAFQLEYLPWDILLNEGVLYVSYRSHVIPTFIDFLQTIFMLWILYTQGRIALDSLLSEIYCLWCLKAVAY